MVFLSDSIPFIARNITNYSSRLRLTGINGRRSSKCYLILCYFSIDRLLILILKELCLGGVDKLTDKYFDYVYDNVDGWRRRRKGEPVQTKWERNENYRIRQANIKDDNNQNDNDNRGQEMQRSMPQQPQQRQPNGSQTRRYHYQPPLNAAYLREDEARPPPALPPPPYASYRKPNTQLRQRRSDDDIGYYVCSFLAMKRYLHS